MPGMNSACIHKSGMFFLSYLLNKQADLVLLETDNGREYLKRNFKKSCGNFFFWGITLNFAQSLILKDLLKKKKKEHCMSHVNDNNNVRIKLD